MIWINKRLPFKGYIAMAIFPFIFVRTESKDNFNDAVENHERIHFEQQKELIILLFYVLYIIEFIFKLFICKGEGYKNISFEREAKAHQGDLNYLKNRRRFAFLKYLFKRCQK